jgi:hypothetical protein
MNCPDHLERFALGFPFPWSDAPGDSAVDRYRSHRRGPDQDQQLMDLEQFLDRYRQRMVLQAKSNRHPEARA